MGAVAGAGASIADALVAAQYAPGTFTIKAIEGFLVGFITKKLNQKIKSLTVCATIAIIIGGFEMVAGYFLYETLALGYPALVAAAEVPFNIVQMLIGLIVAVPIMHAVLKGITRDQMMARHKSNHIQVVYAPDRKSARHGMFAKAAAMRELGLEVYFCGKI